MSQTRENETGRGKPAFWYEPAVSGRTIVDDALSTPHPRAGRRQPVRTPAGHLSTAENGQEPPEGKTPATRENAETAYGKRYVDAVEEQPSPGSGDAHAQRLLELVNPLMTVFMEGCRHQATHQYWVRREPCRRDIGHPLRIALAIQPDACAHPKIGPRLSVVRIQDHETGTAVEVEALGETPAVVRAKATAEAPWRQIDFHDSDMNAAIAHAVDPAYEHRSLPARIDVLEQIAHFLYDDKTIDRKGQVSLTEPDEKVTTITATPKKVLELVAETVTAARGAYGEIGWTLDAIDSTGARIVLHSPQNETISDTLQSNWVDDREPPKPELETVKAHQSNRRLVQKLISEALGRQNKRPIWDGTPYQTRITGFTLTAAGE